MRVVAEKIANSPTNEHTHALIKRGYEVVAGVDEVGRGCLAGPVVVAAVVLPPQLTLEGANDSKLLTLKARERLALAVKRLALGVGLGWVSADQIDEYGLTWAVRQAAKLALTDMGINYHAVLLDGQHNYLGDHCVVQTVVKGDSKCLNIAAASIIAKVARDNYMRMQHQLYPEYGFNKHVGYGTQQHVKALAHGPSPLHRRSFAPVAKLAEISGTYVN